MFEVALGITLIAFIWICFGVIGGGYLFAYSNEEAPLTTGCCDYDENRRNAYGMIPFGLIAFCSIVLVIWRFSINVKPDYSYLYNSGRK